MKRFLDRFMDRVLNHKTSLSSLLVLTLLLLSGCAAKVIDISGSYPAPLVSRLPVTIGVYYDEAFMNHSYIEINDNTGDDEYIINNGASQVDLFNTILPSLFAEVILIESLDTITDYPQIDAVFAPVIEEFQVGLPLKTKLDIYEVWLKYNMRLSTPQGSYIADWEMVAYGKAPRDASIQAFQSISDGINDSTILALRDLAASFSLGFRNIPEVHEWLDQEGFLNE